MRGGGGAPPFRGDQEQGNVEGEEVLGTGLGRERRKEGGRRGRDEWTGAIQVSR
jgi:hypothetical protein